jgi:hypothetical protein
MGSNSEIVKRTVCKIVEKYNYTKAQLSTNIGAITQRRNCQLFMIEIHVLGDVYDI